VYIVDLSCVYIDNTPHISNSNQLYVQTVTDDKNSLTYLLESKMEFKYWLFSSIRDKTVSNLLYMLAAQGMNLVYNYVIIRYFIDSNSSF